MRENNTRVRNDVNAILSVNAIPNVQKENLICNTIEDSKHVMESTFKNVKSLEKDGEYCQDIANSKQIATNDNFFLVKTATASLFIKKKKLTSAKDFNESKKVLKSRIKSVNDNSVETFSLPNGGFNFSKFYISCRFCRRGFETLEYFSTHECSERKSISNLKVHKCKSCSLTFTQKHYLNKHMKDHKRNNCTICSAQITKRKALCKHLRIEHDIIEPEKLHHCSFCNKHFFKRRSLYLHLKSHVDDQFFCLECGFACNKEHIYNDHVQEHSKNLKYECHLCGRKFARRQQYNQHMIGHEKHLCSHCNITFSTKKLFLKHQQSVHHIPVEKRKHPCPVCKKQFYRPIQLQIHQRIHTGEKPVTCSHCEKNFSNDRSLTKHMKTVKHLQQVNNCEGKSIEIEKPYLCSECGAKFYQQQSLLRHVEIIHSARESSKCPYCEYNTKVKTNLKRHIELHTNTKHFICKLCGSSFRAFATLKEHHSFVHSENREFVCNICNKGFKNKSSLQRHMRIHSENRPYKCHCDRAYKRMSHLKRHMVTAHHLTFKKSQIPIIKENTNLDNFLNGENIISLVKSSKTQPNESSCENFSVLNNTAICTELSESNKNESAYEHQLSTFDETDGKHTDVPSKTMQIFTDSSETNISDESKSTLIASVSTPSIEPSPACVLPDPQSVSLNDPNLNLSHTFNLPFSPLNSNPIESVILPFEHSTSSQDEFSFPSNSNSLIRPHSLPNLNFQVDTSSTDTFTNFSLHNADSPTSLHFPSLLSEDIASPLHRELNLGQSSSPKQLFGESDSVLSLTYPSNKELQESNCSEHYPAKGIELWNIGDNTSSFKIFSNDLVTSTCTTINFPTNVTYNANNLFLHNLFSSDSLMVSTLDTTLNSEFDAVSNLC